MTHYDRIEKVIRYVCAHQAEQPDLEVLAAVSGLSPYHFHRLFASWAGVTPKAFLQCLTLEHARAWLQKGASVMDAALEAGLSGAGRLHDLTVKLEAASPGEIKSGGEGWRIRYGIADSPFGPALIAEGPRGICHLSFNVDAGRLRSDWSRADLVRDDEWVRSLGALLFRRASDDAAGRSLKLYVRGTDFQVKVWRALLQVPEGALVSYGSLAACIGKAGASRAVGSAVGKNPIGLLIPCHRVIRESGAIGGYAWGVERKRAIQGWEAVYTKKDARSDVL